MSSFFSEGLEDNDLIRYQIYSNTDLIIMCFSIDSQDSLKNIKMKWMWDVHRFCPRGTVLSQLFIASFFMCVKSVMMYGYFTWL